MKFIDLFSGLGGFHVAASSLGGECVFASEINESLRFTYEKNFGLLPSGDIREVDPVSIPDHDLLCGGFPCQPFSKAGTQAGLQDSMRGTVFFNIIEILKAKRPKYLILENVAHFVKHDEGRTYETVCAALREVGYDINCHTMSPHQFGVPQIRERMYLVGCLDGLGYFSWPEPYSKKEDLSIRSVLDQNPVSARILPPQVQSCISAWQQFLDLIPCDLKLPSFPIWSMEFGCTYSYDQPLSELSVKELQKFTGPFGQSLAGLSRASIMEALPNYADTNGKDFPVWKKAFIRQNREFYYSNKKYLGDWVGLITSFPPSLQKLEWNCQGEKRDLSRHILQFRASGLRVKRASTSPSLVAMTTTQVPIIPWENRYMTIRECARLQSMDDVEYFPASVEESMKALGNAVNTHVISLILNQLIPEEQCAKLKNKEAVSA